MPGGKKRAAEGSGGSNSRQTKAPRRGSEDRSGKALDVASKESAPLGLMFDKFCEDRLSIDPPFAGEKICVIVYLGSIAQNGSRQLEKGRQVPLKVDVQINDETDDSTNTRLLNTSEKASLLNVLSENPQISKTGGYCKLPVVFLKPHRSIQLVVAEKGSHSDIAPATFSKFSVVTHKLSITKPLDKTWYKDQGGRDKCMELNIQLKDQDGLLVTDREIPLIVTLHYDFHGRPQARPTHHNQTIALLQTTKTCDPTVRNGKACIRVRINDVSKNHQSRAFIVKVSPDIAANPGLFDVAATWSTPVIVKSKVNLSKRKKVKKKMNMDMNNELLAAAGYNSSVDKMRAAMQISHGNAIFAMQSNTGVGKKSVTSKSVAGKLKDHGNKPKPQSGPPSEGSAPGMPSQSAAALRSVDYSNLGLPPVTNSLTEAIQQGTIGPQAAASVIVTWGNCVKNWLEQTYRQMSTFARFNSQVAQPLLQLLLKQACDGQLSGTQNNDSRGSKSSSVGIRNCVDKGINGGGNAMDDRVSEGESARNESSSGDVVSASAMNNSQIVQNLSSPERHAASALLLSSMQPGLDIGPSALGSRQTSYNFLNDMLGQGSLSQVEKPSLITQNSLAPLNTSFDRLNRDISQGILQDSNIHVGYPDSPLPAITDEIEKQIYTVQIRRSLEGQKLRCPCFDRNGAFLGEYSLAGMRIEFVEAKKVSSLHFQVLLIS